MPILTRINMRVKVLLISARGGVGFLNSQQPALCDNCPSYAAFCSGLLKYTSLGVLPSSDE